jgi:hypothetical protein
VAEIRSKPITPEYEKNHARVFGERKATETGRFVFRPGHPHANERGFVPAHLIHAEPESKLQISVDRNYENLRTTDGVEINSRRQHKEYMKEHGVTVADDFKENWKKKEKERERYFREGNNTEQDRKERRETVARAFHERHKP